MSISTALNFIDSWMHRSMGTDVILTSGNLARKHPSHNTVFSNTLTSSAQQYICNIYRCAVRENVKERDKTCWREREGARKAQFNSVLSLSTLSSGPVRNQQQESGIKRLCTERRSWNCPSYSPQRLSESHTLAPALSFFFHWLSLWILSNNSHSGGGWGCIPGLSLCAPRIRSPHGWIWMPPLWYYPRASIIAAGW